MRDSIPRYPASARDIPIYRAALSSFISLPFTTQQLGDPALRCRAWRHLAELAEERGDAEAAATAWKNAALAH